MRKLGVNSSFIHRAKSGGKGGALAHRLSTG